LTIIKAYKVNAYMHWTCTCWFRPPYWSSSHKWSTCDSAQFWVSNGKMLFNCITQYVLQLVLYSKLVKY